MDGHVLDGARAQTGWGASSRAPEDSTAKRRPDWGRATPQPTSLKPRRSQLECLWLAMKAFFLPALGEQKGAPLGPFFLSPLQCQWSSSIHQSPSMFFSNEAMRTRLSR